MIFIPIFPSFFTVMGLKNSSQERTLKKLREASEAWGTSKCRPETINLFAAFFCAGQLMIFGF